MNFNGNTNYFMYVKKEMKTNITDVFKKELPRVLTDLSLLENGF